MGGSRVAHLGGGPSGAAKNMQQCIQFAGDLLCAVTVVVVRSLVYCTALFCSPVCRVDQKRTIFRSS